MAAHALPSLFTQTSLTYPKVLGVHTIFAGSMHPGKPDI